MSDSTEYDPRYLAGILFFNRRDFFEAHEVWEDIWGDCGDDVRLFYKSLIQAAVGLHHFGNGNLRGAEKLYRTSRGYMEGYPSPYLGLDVKRFWDQMAVCFAPVLAEKDLLRRDLRTDESRIPTITLDPEPSEWPDPEQFVEADH